MRAYSKSDACNANAAPAGRGRGRTAETGSRNQLWLRLATRSQTAPPIAPVQPRLTVQAKLNVSQPGDPFEREADRVADHIATESHSPGPTSLLGSGGSEQIHRLSAEVSPAFEDREPDDEMQQGGQPAAGVARLARSDAADGNDAAGGATPESWQARLASSEDTGAPFRLVRLLRRSFGCGFFEHTDSQRFER